MAHKPKRTLVRIITDVYTDKHAIITDVYTDMFTDDGTQTEAHACQNLPTEVAKPMLVCSGTQFPMDLPTDIEKYGGIFEIFARVSIKYQRILPTEFNATAQNIIIIFFVDNSVGNIEL
jgi:hypothetical protein